MKALICFHNDSEHSLAWLLKKDFRHCFVCVLTERDGVGYWLSLDPHLGIPQFEVQCGTDFALKAHLESFGCIVVETERLNPSLPRMPWALANCVGVVKFVLGLRAPFVITPYQLYKRIKR